MKYLVIFAFCLIVTKPIKAQDSVIDRTVTELYQELSNRSDYTYLIDTTIKVFPFDFRDLYSQVRFSDSDLLRKVILNGIARPINVERLKSILPSAKFLKNRDAFYDVKPVYPPLTKSELRTQILLSSVIKMSLSETQTGPRATKLKHICDSLFSCASFTSGQAKFARSDKRIMIIYPALEFNGHILIAIVCFHSSKNSYLFTKLL